MKLTKRNLKILIESFLLEDAAADEEVTVVEVVDPCEKGDQEMSDFLQSFPNFPVGLAEVLGECGKGIVALELEFGDGSTSQVYLESTEEDLISDLKENMVLLMSKIKELKDKAMMRGITPQDTKVIDNHIKKLAPDTSKGKTASQSGLVPDYPEHNISHVGVDHGQGMGTYLYQDDELVKFIPRGKTQ